MLIQKKIMKAHSEVLVMIALLYLMKLWAVKVQD